jgi:hypothetical protein
MPDDNQAIIQTGRERIVYGVRCTWWDSIAKIGKLDGGLPCCPHCRGVLFEVDNEEQWWSGVDRYEAAGHPGYRAKMEWARGRCFPNFQALVDAFEHREEAGAE